MNSSYRLVCDAGDYLVIDKAPGVNLHRNQSSESLLDILKTQYPDTSLHLVHRLDDATSGLLLIAKSSAAAAELGDLFAKRNIEKYYVALADGKPLKKQGAVVGDIKKSRGGSYLLSRTRLNPSVTQFQSFSVRAGRRVYLLKPKTGKTHQLRVVMKSLGVAILGDKRYGPTVQDGDRMYLHAMALRFCYQGVDCEYVCPPVIGDAFGDGGLQEILLSCLPPWTLDWPRLN